MSNSGRSKKGGPPFYGKYKGVVKDNKDPLMLGRVQASVTAVYGTGTSGWARPCMPFGGPGMGLSALPALGAWVWVEFEDGDPSKPIWSGCFWEDPTDVPPILRAPPWQKVLLQTEEGHCIILDDTPGVGGITLQTVTGEKMTMSAQGITLETAVGHKLSITPLGIKLQTVLGASVDLAGLIVSLNGNALKVVP